MANNGFSAPTNYWGSITGLTPTSSSDGRANQVAEALNKCGDVIAHDVYGDVLAPSTDYAVTGDFDLSQINLGSIHQVGTTARRVMLTTVTINTQAGSPPTVTISGVGVESGAAATRTYALAGVLYARDCAQDPCGGLVASTDHTSITTTCSVQPQVATVAGAPVASDCSNGRIEVNVTATDPTGTGTVTANTAAGWDLTALTAETAPDGDYITRTATATKYLTPTGGGSSSV